VVHDAVPRGNVEAVVDAIHAFLGIPREKDDTWYQPPVNAGGMVEMYQHQALWDNRQYERIYDVYRQLWGRDDLWVSMDRCSFKPPPDPRFPQFDKIGFMHLDANPYEGPISFFLQGVLYLSDTAADQGGFHCMPGWHKRTEEWMKLTERITGKQTNGVRGAELKDLPDRTPIEGKAGDLVIWQRALPHGNGWNTSTRPRLAQYILMSPAKDIRSEEAAARVKAWREHAGPMPGFSYFPGDPRGWEREHLQTATLTELGEKLLGLKSWG
jgi:ectoine hydroxylase-related dioxygenase (phytanoyl-CoA dioxygenase family)